MAYFLKKLNQKGRTYIAICDSFYNPRTKGTSQKIYKSLGSVETWQEKGLEDPIAHFQKEVDELNRLKQAEGTRKISDKAPILHLGYFPFKAILEKLNIKHWIDFFNKTYDFEFDLYELMSSLIYARAVKPCSKHRTFHEVLPELYEPVDYSYDQLLDGLEFLGNVYEKILEIFTVTTKKVFGLNFFKSYFDCTNFYFEIDREDDFRRKGPSKENRKEPIVGLGLLLDSNQIPVWMNMYPGNESEKPVLREVLAKLKRKGIVAGRTIHVADKGLNCAQNIAYSKKNGDGYLFSKSVKTLPEVEKTWVLLKDDYKQIRDSKGNILYYCKSCVDKFPYTIEHEGKKVTVNLTEKRLVTYSPILASKKRYEINRMVEKARGLTASQAKRAEYGETGKYVSFSDKDGKTAIVTINEDAIKKDLDLAGFNLLVTSEINMTDADMHDTYSNLWRIEESFKIMKSDLDARPVFLQKEDAIKGHFLICYLTVLLERLFQFKVLKNQYSTNEIFKFVRDFNVTKGEYKYINTAKYTNFIKDLGELLQLPLTEYWLSDTDLSVILNCKVKAR